MARKEQENIVLRKTGCVDGTLIQTPKGYFLTLKNPFGDSECWVLKEGEEIGRGTSKVRFPVTNRRATYVLRTKGEKLKLNLSYLKERKLSVMKDMPAPTE